MYKAVTLNLSRLIFLTFLFPCFAWGQDVGASNSEPTPSSQQVALIGWFHIIWEDSLANSAGESKTRYVLIDDQNQWTELLLEEGLTKPLGGPLALNRQRVRVAGEKESIFSQTLQADSQSTQWLWVQAIEFENSQTVRAVMAPLAVAGPQPFITILCRFADSTSVTPHPRSWYETLMGSSYPGLDHYWREVSYGMINLTGSVVLDWYNLPQPRSYYIPPEAEDDPNKIKGLVEDCTTVADADVFFPNFAGINLIFNEDLGCCASGGSTPLTRDGQTKSYRLTWIALGE
jgi:hypothetical protein